MTEAPRMTKFVANLGIAAGQIALMFCNYWFAFGLWPRSWFAFFACAIGVVALLALKVSVDREK